MVQTDILSFPSLISPDFVYVNDQGESLKAEDLIKELEEGTIDVDSVLPKASFDVYCPYRYLSCAIAHESFLSSYAP